MLLLGLAYTVLYKLVCGLLSGLCAAGPGRALASLLWLVATAALIVFAWRYLVELRPRNVLTRASLLAIVACTAVVILSKLPFWPAPGMSTSRLVFGVASFLNSIALLTFVASLARVIGPESPLRAPLRVLLGGCTATAILGVVSIGGYVAYLVTGLETTVLPMLKPLAQLVFVITYGAAIWFLARFGRLADYGDLTGR